MREPYSRSGRGAPYSMLFVSIGYVALAVLLSSCSTDFPHQRETQPAEEGTRATPYSMVCVIHGDGDYLYHDTTGTEYKADEEALAGAKRVAQQNPSAEVFIFHQKPRSHFAFIFPLRDGEFYYYRNGRLTANASYWRDQEHSRFEPEVELYRRYRADNQPVKVSVFLYYGHEIPEFGGRGYDASYADRPFTVQDFADGVKSFTRDSARFDLAILSTCFGGTPYTIGALGPSARYIVASPDNLHLSYFDLQPLERLDLSLRDGDAPALAKKFAYQAFDRLTRDIQTAVSVAVYDVDLVQPFLHSVQGMYDHMLTALKDEPQASLAAIEHCDCADLPAYVQPTMNKGVDLFYRPARFGRLKYKQNHSGWECWKEGLRKAATSLLTSPSSGD